MAAPTIVPRLMRMPRLSRYSFTACNIAPPRSCFSLADGGTAKSCSRLVLVPVLSPPSQSAAALAIRRVPPPPPTRQVEPLLQKVHPQLDRQPKRRPPILPLGIVWFDQTL